MNIFLTSTIHNDYNLDFNPKLVAKLEANGLVVHMPQRDTNQEAPIPMRVKENMKAIEKANASVVVLENASMNLAAETGFTYGIGCPTIGLARKGTFIDGMLQGALSVVIVVDDIEDINSYITKLVKTIKKFARSL